MTAQISTYGFKNVQATLDGQPVTGFFDSGEVVVVAPINNRSNLLVGADGSAIHSVSADRSMTITLRLKHTSPTHRLLTQKLRNMESRGGNARTFPFDVQDTTSGEGGSAEQCMIQSPPGQSNAMDATVREWVLVTGTWITAIPREVS